jgi:predicted nucleic acid-binding protein
MLLAVATCASTARWSFLRALTCRRERRNFTRKCPGKGEADTVERLLAQGVLGTTTITRFELLCGARTAAQLTRITRLLETLPALPLDERAADAAADIRRTLERLGHPIGMADSLIAGIPCLST